MMKFILTFIGLSALLFVASAGAADGVLPAVTVKTAADGSTEYSVTMQILLLMTSLSFIPA
ncbi:MAG: flagellar type III secretion system pore protein FliP, partial [Shewanella sp.]